MLLAWTIPIRAGTAAADSSPISPAALPDATAGASYSASVSVVGGAGPYTYTITGLPDALNGSANGSIAGIPAAAGDSTVQVVYDNGAGDSNSGSPASVSLHVNAAVAITAATMDAAAGQSGTIGMLAASGGTAPITYNCTDSNKPTWVAVGGDGSVSVTNASAGSYPFTVTVSDAWGSAASATLTITVTGGGGSGGSGSGSGGGTVAVTGVSLNKTGDTIPLGSTDQLTATVAPSNATDQTVTWASSDDSVATVDSTGKVTAVGLGTDTVDPGTATITATTGDGSFTATCSVTVLALNLTSDTITVSNQVAVVLITTVPNATWSSDNTGVATVDQSGNVTAVSSGTTNIDATDAEGDKATCAVTAIPASQSIPVRTAQDLASVGFNLTGNYVQMNDLDLTGSDWAPIGYNIIGGESYPAGSSFCGVFDGKGHKISGISMDSNSIYEGGMFSQVSGAQIRNVNVVDASYTGDDAYAFGMLAGAASGSTISNCSVAGSISSNGLGETGGLIGSSASDTITGCDSAVAISSPGGGWEVGGLIGASSADTISTSCSTGGISASGQNIALADAGGLIGSSSADTISASYSTGNMSDIARQGIALDDVGGLIGDSLNDTISTSYSTGGMSDAGQDVALAYAGGLIGASSADTISTSYSTGGISASGQDPELAYVGGLIGASSEGSISGCDSTAGMTATETSSSLYGANLSYVGGLIGSSSSDQISTCYFNGGISVSGQDGGYFYCAGGLIGASSSDAISTSYSTASITDTAGNNSVADYSAHGVGGLIGDSSSDSISISCSTGDIFIPGYGTGGLIGCIESPDTIANDYSQVNITCPGADNGDLYGVGGLIGAINQGATPDIHVDSSVSSLLIVATNQGGTTITDCYAAGSVPDSLSGATGGLVGNFDAGNASVNSSYYDEETSGQPDNGAGTPEPTSLMMQQSTFVGWDWNYDGSGIWAIHEGTGYPYFGIISPAPVAPPAVMIAISPSTLPDGQAGAVYSQTLTASGGTAPYTFSETGSLPDGWTLAATGALTGTPTQAGSFPISVTATDANGNTGSQAYTLTVDQAPAPPAPTVTVTISPTTIPGGTVGTAYSQTFTATGGTFPYTYGASAGALPPGLDLSSAGVLTGTPTRVGASSFTVTATDAYDNAGSQAYTLTVDPAPAPVPTVAGLAVTPNSVTLAVNQQASAVAMVVYSDASTLAVTQAATWSSSNSQIASVSNGRIAAVAPGTATVTASYDGETGTVAVTVTSPAPPAPAVTIAISPANLPSGMVGTAYNQALTASGGTAPYTFGETGNLPDGLTLGSDGILSGIPAQSGTSSFIVTATDADDNAGSQAYTLMVDPAATPPAPTQPTIIGLAVTPGAMALNVSQQSSAVATAVYSDTSTADVTAQATWSSSNSQVATVSKGQITAVAPGTATITATYEELSGTVAAAVYASGGGTNPIISPINPLPPIIPVQPVPAQPIPSVPPVPAQPIPPVKPAPVHAQPITPVKLAPGQPVMTKTNNAPAVIPAPVAKVWTVTPVPVTPAPAPTRHNPVLPVVGGLALVAAIAAILRKRPQAVLLALLPYRVVSVAISSQPAGSAMASLAFDDTKRRPEKVIVDVVNKSGEVIAKGVVVIRSQSTDIALPAMALKEKMWLTAKTRGYRNISKNRTAEFNAAGDR
jgi:uncharacterized protein YjdB